MCYPSLIYRLCDYNNVRLRHTSSGDNDKYTVTLLRDMPIVKMQDSQQKQGKSNKNVVWESFD